MVESSFAGSVFVFLKHIEQNYFIILFQIAASFSLPRVNVNSLDLSVVMKFNIKCFGQQQTQTTCNKWNNAIYKHGELVVVDLQESDQGGECARHTATHRI